MTIAKIGSKTKLSEARLSLLGIAFVALLSLVGTVIQAQQNAATQKQLNTLTVVLETRSTP